MSGQEAFKGYRGHERTLPSLEPKPRKIHTEKYIAAEQLQTLVYEGSIRYVEFDRVEHLDFRIIQAINQLKATGIPLAVNVGEVTRGDLFSKAGVDHFFRSLENVDYVLALHEGSNFSLHKQQEGLLSTTSFIGSAIGETTKQRMRRRSSTFSASLSETQIQCDKFISPESIAELARRYQKEGKNMTVACGTFDVLHPGHVAFLEQTASFADVLLVLTNSDLSIKLQPKSIQGDRPIHPLSERVAVLSALEYVDHVSSFDERTAEELFEKLQRVTYVKTEKDRNVPGVVREKDIVLRNGGQYVELKPLDDMARGVALCSTDVIFRFRDEEEVDEDLSSDYTTFSSEIVLKKTREITSIIRRWNKETNSLSQLKKQLKGRFEKGIDSASKVEESALEGLIDAAANICKECGDARSYYEFIIPELAGKMVGLDIGTISIQENKKDVPVRLVNVLKRSDGKVVFFSVPTRTVSDAVAFEEEFWRSTPYNANFLPHDRKNAIKRIYVYPEAKHTLGTTLRILLEEYANAQNSQEKQRLADEINSLGKTAFMLFEGTSREVTNEDHHDIKLKRKDSVVSAPPKIVGHGGSSIVETSGGSIGFGENTRSGILHALNSGVDVIEVDIVPCKDGWVASHDIKLSVSTEAEGLTTEKTEDEIRQIRIKLATGEISKERLLTMADVLDLVAGARNAALHEGYLLKLDLKFSNTTLEDKFIETLQSSGLPLNKILLTSGFSNISQRLHALAPELQWELNTVEPTLFLTQYGIMDQELMPELFLSYVQTYSKLTNAKVVSMMNFAMRKWGDSVSLHLLSEIAAMGLESQIWVVASMKDYEKYTKLGASYVLMHNPALIKRVMERKNN